MVIWEIAADSNTFRSFYVENMTTSEALDLDQQFRWGRPLGNSWPITHVGLFEDEGYENEREKPIGDFPSCAGIVPLYVSDRALKLLLPIIKDRVEVLDTVAEAGEFHALNVLFCDCLDHSRSVFEQFADGRIIEVQQYAFNPGRLSGVHIFRLPELWCYTFVDDVYKQTVEQNALQGLLFRKVSDLNTSPEA